MTTAAQRETRFNAWLTEHRGIVHKIARAYETGAANQADLFQEMALQLWNSLPAFREEAKAATWIYRVCLNTALTWRRDAVRRERRIEPGADLTRLAVDGASPADHAGDRELLETLYAAIRALPDFDRALVLLSLDGVPYREIAEVTGLTENHVGVALTRARKHLAKLMKGATDELE